ncbi:hypothetical protein AU192_16385 [Mycobacterium terramassiliense]|uniref:Helix-turn-helix domain-containing protein n=1 Tax=Mycobacterium terramassiliense TaxID=1841859 RepID=A0A2U3NKT3_9MYCO|nr:hypothetical protein AU192_16385 [Mycobacterium terramassiliense]
MPACPNGPHTHSVAETCALIGCESEDWLIDRVRNGTFPARRIVRQLRFSDDDIAQIIETCAVQSGRVPTLPTPTARRRRQKSD